MSSSIERLRAERLQREAEEKRRTQALLDQRSGKRKESERELNERERPYNSAYFPELARKRQRRDQDSWREEILKSWLTNCCLKVDPHLWINVCKQIKKTRENKETTTLCMRGYHGEAAWISRSSICIYFHAPQPGNACSEVRGQVHLQLPLCPPEHVIRADGTDQRRIESNKYFHWLQSWLSRWSESEDVHKLFVDEWFRLHKFSTVVWHFIVRLFAATVLHLL